MKFFTALLSALAFAASTATATPIEVRSAQIVVSPHITSPKGGEDWPVGTVQTVTWETNEIPPEAQGYTGAIYLGFDDGTGSENLSGEPLAQGFLLISGSQTITIPDVVDKTTYFVVLMGDSGNTSPQFTISSSY